MYKIKTSIELPMAHCLDNAYSGLCVGNIDRSNEEYFVDRLLPTVHGHQNVVTITVGVDDSDLNNDGMVVDFKLFKEIIRSHMQKYDHSCVVSKNNPLAEVYRAIYVKNDVSLAKSRMFVIGENPTSETLVTHWYYELLFLFCINGINVKFLELEFEETPKNSCSYNAEAINCIDNMICGIYQLYNKKTKKIYIGQSINILRCWFDELVSNSEIKTLSSELKDIIRVDNWDCSILELCEPSELNGKEQYWTWFYNSCNPDFGYNEKTERSTSNDDSNNRSF